MASFVIMYLVPNGGLQMLKNKDDLSAREVANDLLLIARVFTGSIALFMIMVGLFNPWAVNAVIRATILLFSIGFSTLIAVGIMLFLIESGCRFSRIFKDE